MRFYQAALAATLGLCMASVSSGALTEDWESVPAGTPSSAPASGAAYNITSTVSATGMGTWTARSSDTSSNGGYDYVNTVGNSGNAGGTGNVMTDFSSNRDASTASVIIQSPAFTLSDAAAGGSLSVQYIGGSTTSNPPTTIAGLGTNTNGGAAGFMGIALVDPSGNVVATAADGAAGSGSTRTLTLNYSGLSATTAYTLALIDNGTRGTSWGWNGLDTVSIPAGTLAAPEPASMALLGFGCLGLLARRRRA